MTCITYVITSAFSTLEVDWQCCLGVILHVASRCGGTKSRVAGLIKAACGQLEAFLQNNGNVSQLSADTMSNGHTKIKILQNGHTTKSANGLLNAAYGNAVACPWKDVNHCV